MELSKPWGPLQPMALAKTHRNIILPIAGLPCLALLVGCVTPIVATGQHFGVGLFRVSMERYEHGVVRTRLTGVGVLTGTYFTAVGYSDRDGLIVPLDGRHYHVKTPIADLYVGDQAVGAVGQWMADYHQEILGRKPRGSVGQEGHVKNSEQDRSPNVKTKGEGK